MHSADIQTPNDPTRTLHTNAKTFRLTREASRARALDAAQRKVLTFGRFGCLEHFSLAKPLHLAIMSGQLGNAWDARFHRQFDNAALHSALSCDSS